MTALLNIRVTLMALSLASLTAGNINAGDIAPPKPATAPNPAAASAPASLPALSLPDLEGKVHDSKEWKNKVLVLDFWATWCTGCRETIPVLVRLNDKFGPKGLAVAGISIDKLPKEKVAKFARKQKMSYPILCDSEDTMSKIFGFEGIPSVYVFGRDGKLLKALPAYTPAEEKSLEALVEAEFQGKP
jgi:thiol-disulfide isomerase/thioredoxin